jgi:sideroflexin-5
VTDPTTLLLSIETLKNAKRNIDYFRLSGKMAGSDEEMWKFKSIVDASIHPDTNEIIPRLFRVSAIAPVNIPICYAMLQCPSTNVAGTLFLHWVNQSYNTACNYANRSGTSRTIEETAKAYILAVTSACAFAYGMGRLGQLGPIIPVTATAAANCSNVCLTRLSEVTEGTQVRDEDGVARGLSKVAGVQGVFQTALTRCVLVPVACLLVPPVIMSGLRSARLLPKNPRITMLVELAVIYGSLQAAMPAALAVFPQTAKFEVSDLEPEFRSLTDRTGRPITHLYANKGL